MVTLKCMFFIFFVLGIAYMALTNWLYGAKVLPFLTAVGKEDDFIVMPSEWLKRFDVYVEHLKNKGRKPWFYWYLKHIRYIWGLFFIYFVVMVAIFLMSKN